MRNDNLLGLSHQFVLSLLHFQAACPALPVSQGELRAGSRAFSVLFTLCHHPEEHLTMSHLASCLQVSQPQLSKVVGTLEEQRLVRRRHDDMNRRLVYISVTAAGRKMMESITMEAADGFLPHLSSLSPEERQRLEESLRTLDSLLVKAGCRSW